MRPLTRRCRRFPDGRATCSSRCATDSTLCLSSGAWRVDMADPKPRLASMRDLGDGRVGIWASFEHKEAQKALPSARWDPSLKCWHVDRMFRAEAKALVDRINGGIDAEGVRLFTAMFRLLPARLRQDVYCALARVLHPDRGGDEQAMKMLTAGWDEVQR